MTRVVSQPYHLDYRGEDPALADLFTSADEMFTLLFANIGAGGSTGGSGEAQSAELDALAALASTGLVTRTGAATYTTRTITAGANIGVTNGSGVAGNPTIALTGIGSAIEAWDADLDAIAALGSTGFAVRTAGNTWAQRTITGGTGISVTNGDGVAGNPSIAFTGSAGASLLQAMALVSLRVF